MSESRQNRDVKTATHPVTRAQAKRGSLPEQEPAHTLRSRREPSTVTVLTTAQESDVFNSPSEEEEPLIRTRSHRSPKSKSEDLSLESKPCLGVTVV